MSQPGNSIIDGGRIDEARRPILAAQVDVAVFNRRKILVQTVQNQADERADWSE